jgi:glycerol-3-phosphate dehydrogenase
MKKPNIVILGMGEIGSVLFPLFRKQKYPIEAWDKVPQKVPHQKSLFEIIPKADLLFLCIPSWYLNDVIKSIGPFVHKQTVFVLLSKGLQQTKEIPYSLISTAFPHNDVIALGGAMLAEEIEKGMPGIAVIAGKNPSNCNLVKNCFKKTSIVCFDSKDPESSSFASVLKNIYSLGLGMAGGMGWGGNGRALLAREALFEMGEISKILGIKKEVMYGPSGFIDLIATGFSEYSKNVEVGKLIISQKKQFPKSEGLVSLEPMKKLLGVSMSKFPLFIAIYQSVHKRGAATEIFSKYIKRIEKK